MQRCGVSDRCLVVEREVRQGDAKLEYLLCVGKMTLGYWYLKGVLRCQPALTLVTGARVAERVIHRL